MADIDEVRRQAFTELYEACYWPIVRFASRRLTDRDAARDLAAETFVVAWQRWEQMPRARPLPWLYRVAGNLLSNHRRHQSKETLLSQEVEESARSEVDVASQVELRDELAAVMAAMRTLREGDQEILRLHAWEGLRPRDLAPALGCTAAAAAVRLHRARRRLEAALRRTPSSSAGPYQPLPRRSTTLERTRP